MGVKAWSWLGMRSPGPAAGLLRRTRTGVHSGRRLAVTQDGALSLESDVAGSCLCQ